MAPSSCTVYRHVKGRIWLARLNRREDLRVYASSPVRYALYPGCGTMRS